MSRLKATLRYIQSPADFRYSEPRLYASVPKEIALKLSGNDCIAFVSATGNQILFMYRTLQVGKTAGNKLYQSRRRELFSSYRLRLNVGTFNPALLANYAGKCGLELTGLKRFEERYRQLLEES